jgi:hypothetical protein
MLYAGLDKFAWHQDRNSRQQGELHALALSQSTSFVSQGLTQCPRYLLEQRTKTEYSQLISLIVNLLLLVRGCLMSRYTHHSGEFQPMDGTEIIRTRLWPNTNLDDGGRSTSGKLSNDLVAIYLGLMQPSRSRNSSVGIATGYEMDGREIGVRVPVQARFFSSIRRPDRLRRSQPPIHWVPGALYPGVKRPGHEANHSPPASAEVNNTWIYTSTPILLHGAVLS